MVQREVAERLTAPVGSRASGAVTVKLAFYSSARVVGAVPATVFVPRPNVESALVEIRRHAQPPVDVEDPARLFALVQAGFAHRRKTLRKALAGAVPDAGGLLAAAGIESARRAEELTLGEWAALAGAETAAGAA